jgi:threonine dehydrogenase-like Zn-dependent dehydrogenase
MMVKPDYFFEMVHIIFMLLETIFACCLSIPWILFITCGLYTGKPVYMYSMGGLAEYCVVPANALAVLPNTLPYTESAILGCAVFTAYGAMRHAAEMRAGDSVAVIGVGGVGSRLFSPLLFLALVHDIQVKQNGIFD